MLKKLLIYLFIRSHLSHILHYVGLMYRSSSNGLREGDEVLYIDRETHRVTYPPVGDKKPKVVTYTREVVYRGVWDGNKAELFEQFDPRRLKTVVRDPKILIKTSL